MLPPSSRRRFCRSPGPTSRRPRRVVVRYEPVSPAPSSVNRLTRRLYCCRAVAPLTPIAAPTWLQSCPAARSLSIIASIGESRSANRSIISARSTTSSPVGSSPAGSITDYDAPSP
ncbi:MAG: hypothetical protein ACK462_02975, partial [Planctomyces sp.]